MPAEGSPSTTDKPIRVIQWGTGQTGVHGLRHILGHPRLELAGVRVYADAKLGRDAGTLVGMDECGVNATDDVDALLALGADCLSFMGADPLISDPREPGSGADSLIGQMCRFLENGVNVVSTSVVGLTYPGYFGEAVVRRIADACDKGGTSFHCAGIDPGFVGEVLLTSVTSLSQEIRSVRYYELLTAKDYNQPEFVYGIGFGKSIKEFEEQGMVFSLSNCWGPTLYGIADALGVVVDDVVTRVEVAPAEQDTEIAAGLIPAGTVGAIHFEVAAVSGGREVIVVEHVNRIDDGIAAQWAKIDGHGGYRVIVEGTPSMTVELSFGHEHTDPTYDACMATAARAVNSIVDVCAAPRGILTYRDLPPIAGKGLVVA